MATKTKPDDKLSLQRLEHTDHPGAKVVVTPENGDRFMLSIRQALVGCNLAVRFERFEKQAEALSAKLWKWIQGRPDKVDRAILGFDRDGITLTLIQKKKAFDPAFHEEVAILDMEIASDEGFDMIRLQIIVVPYCPDETLSTFVDLTNASGLTLA